MTTFLALMIGLAGCSINRSASGLVLEEPNGIVLVEPGGRSLRLQLSGDSAALRHALGCRVELKGTRFGKRLAVHEWKIVDSGYGSQPFVGELVRTGSAWRVRDRNSQTWVELVAESMGGLTTKATWCLWMGL